MTGWHAKLSLAYAISGPRTVVRFEHQGPLRVLQSLYPKATVCATTCWSIHQAVWWVATP
jgi:urease accessory protein UreH